jgi:hypothetical protein
MWGIDGTSCLLAIEDFSWSNLVHDPMHILLEDIVPHNLKVTLYYFVTVDKYFTCNLLNSAIDGFKYSYLHRTNKPERTERNQIAGDGTIKQTAAAMLILVQILPIAIGHCIPRGNSMWLNIIRLLKTVFLRTAPYCHRETAVQLRIMMALHLQEFICLYPSVIYT